MITYRTEKGAPLTTEEMDGNFRELETRLKTLEKNCESGEGIGKILVQGDKMTIVGTFGTEFGTFPLPKVTFNPRGAWREQTLYQKLDVVTHDNGLYCCERDHSSTSWEQEVAFWKELLTLPKLPLPSLPLYEIATLPAKETLGKLSLLMDDKGVTLIFFDGHKWQRLMKGETL